jgi:polyisoprenoid-binding protein YceI
MKTMLLLLISATLMAATETTYRADVATSNIHWLGKKTTGQHDGDVKLKSGYLKMDDKKFVAGEFVIDMNTITCTDIKEAEDAQHLVDHLKNEDFFNTAGFPVATLRLKSLQPGKAAANTYDAVADLTIKGITNEIKFPVVFEKNATGATATADITIDRTKWNVVYKSKTVFSTLGDKFIYDDMYLTVKLALKQ